MNYNFKYSTCNPKRPLSIIFPAHQSVRNVMYHTIAKQDQFVYTNADGITAYNSSPILSPNTVSYINLFVNGVIQPLNMYTVETGKLTLLSETSPLPGTPITLQFLTLY
ncbi:DUF4183 domain-containing protein [Bacillus sp. GeD10]|uniref:DUF4183 domain-containing protein n=1 Tax=Bacillus sp. GeD10 TaxID=1301086 RepID=UPI0002D2247E|nr:DUF4183 domain-containing protein [Bacillus sp. GeD10]CCW08620.1 Collagen triple helix repeat protein [Bacillus sp. GeD10]